LSSPLNHVGSCRELLRLTQVHQQCDASAVAATTFVKHDSYMSKHLSKHPSSEFYSTRDYRVILRNIFEARKLRRSKYSLNAFARDIGLPATRLNSIFKRRYGISRSTSELIAERLNFSTDETKFFCDLTTSEHARTSQERKQAAARLETYNPSNFETISGTKNHIIAKWYYPATLLLTKLNKGKISSQEIASSLGITQKQAKEALKVLTELGELKLQDGSYSYEQKVLAASSAVPSSVIQNFHAQFLDQLKLGISREPVLKRKNRSVCMAFDSSRIEEARLWLENVHNEFINLFSVPAQADSVFGFGIYLSRLDQKQND
jgi:uncharacterized protein (TIGR02147 family)